ncbi:macrosialin-like [Bufo gargarizans]|uniref:macrosialin-like n=1 Tax=Bufo gargarizans TaxID=30331 RepID=UPI001CF444F8|nr:macrosialin-like [Bufo gargarizans]
MSNTPPLEAGKLETAPSELSIVSRGDKDTLWATPLELAVCWIEEVVKMAFLQPRWSQMSFGDEPVHEEYPPENQISQVLKKSGPSVFATMPEAVDSSLSKKAMPPTLSSIPEVLEKTKWLLLKTTTHRTTTHSTLHTTHSSTIHTTTTHTTAHTNHTTTLHPTTHTSTPHTTTHNNHTTTPLPTTHNNHTSATHTTDTSTPHTTTHSNHTSTPHTTTHSNHTTTPHPTTHSNHTTTPHTTTPHSTTHSNHTTTPHPTSHSNHTSAHTNHTSTPHLTTATSPTTVPPSTEYIVNGTNNVCLRITASFKISFNDTTKREIVIPPAPSTQASGNCSAEKAWLTLTFPQGEVTMTFRQDTEGNKFFLGEVNITLKNTGPEKSDNTSLKAMVTPLGRSFSCEKVDIQVTSKVFFSVMNVRAQAFKLEGGTYGREMKCSNGPPSMTVPIVVGVILVALVLIVVIAYIVARQRSQRGYQPL